MKIGIGTGLGFQARYIIRNLLSKTEDLSNVAWTKTGATVDAAGLVTITSNGAVNFITQDATTIAATYAASVEFKAGTVSKMGLEFIDQGVAFRSVNIDLAVPSISAKSGSPSNMAITDVGSGWYRVSFTFPIATGGVDTFTISEGSVPFVIGNTFSVRRPQLEIGTATAYQARP